MPEIPAVKNWPDFVNHMHCVCFGVPSPPPIKGGIREKAKPVK